MRERIRDLEFPRVREFLVGTFAGGIVTGYLYFILDRLCRELFGFAFPDIGSLFGVAVVFMFAVRFGQLRVGHWESVGE